MCLNDTLEIYQVYVSVMYSPFLLSIVWKIEKMWDTTKKKPVDLHSIHQQRLQIQMVLMRNYEESKDRKMVIWLKV